MWWGLWGWCLAVPARCRGRGAKRNAIPAQCKRGNTPATAGTLPPLAPASAGPGGRGLSREGSLSSFCSCFSPTPLLPASSPLSGPLSSLPLRRARRERVGERAPSSTLSSPSTTPPSTSSPSSRPFPSSLRRATGVGFAIWLPPTARQHRRATQTSRTPVARGRCQPAAHAPPRRSDCHARPLLHDKGRATVATPPYQEVALSAPFPVRTKTAAALVLPPSVERGCRRRLRWWRAVTRRTAHAKRRPLEWSPSS